MELVSRKPSWPAVSKQPHQQAGHMDASDPIIHQKALVPRGPSTYGSPLSRGRPMRIQFSNSSAAARRRAFAIPRRDASEFWQELRPEKSEGAGNAGRSMHPQPRVRNKIKHTSVVTTVTPESPGIPRAMVLRLTSRSPRRRIRLVTVIRGLKGCPARSG